MGFNKRSAVLLLGLGVGLAAHPSVGATPAACAGSRTGPVADSGVPSLPEPSPDDVREAREALEPFLAPEAQRKPEMLSRELLGFELEAFRRFDRAAATKRLKLRDDPSVPAASFDGSTFEDALVFELADGTWPLHGYSITVRRCSPHRWQVVDFGLTIE